MFIHSIAGTAGCSPNGSCQLAAYSQPVISLIVGPEDKASESGPLRATLPMEVVTVSMQVTPVTSSLMMWLVLTIDILGAATTPKGMVPRGSSRATSTSSGICRHAVTPAKLCGRVGSCMRANACTGEEGLGGVGVFGWETGGCMGIIWESWLDPTFGFEVLDGWGISPAATTGQDGCRTFSHPKNFWALLSRAGSGTQGTLGRSAERVFRLSSSSFLGRATPWKTSSLVKERYHFTSSLSSITLSANNLGLPPADALFSSTQYWRALAYATTFSQGIS